MYDYIILKTKEDFKEVIKNYKSKWRSCAWFWNNFKENTCYIPTQDCFSSLDKVINKGKEL